MIKQFGVGLADRRPARGHPRRDAGAGRSWCCSGGRPGGCRAGWTGSSRTSRSRGTRRRRRRSPHRPVRDPWVGSEAWPPRPPHRPTRHPGYVQPEVDVVALQRAAGRPARRGPRPGAHQPGHPRVGARGRRDDGPRRVPRAGQGPGRRDGGHRPDRAGLPGGVRRRRRHRRLDRGVRDPGAGRPVGAGQGGRAVRPVRRRDPPARHPRAPRRLPARPGRRAVDGLLRDDRDRPRLQRASARHGRDVRPVHGGVRRAHHRDAARKDYIGSAARHAELAVVFAQLEVGPEDAREGQGVHAFVVPLRRDGAVLPGIRIEDCGQKMGLNGVDNGRIWFDRVRIPRANLLNRFADVSADGTYASAIENPDRRFFTMLGTLVQGRVSVGGAAINASKVALAIATTYAARRRQFEATAPPQEDLLLDYGLHQRRLLPLLARTYALHFAQEVVAGQLHDVFSGAVDDEHARRELESRAAGTKVLGTWHATRTIQECREACGGAGYLVGEPLRGAEGGHGRLHDLRGRQPRAAPAGGQGPADRLRRRVLRPRPVRHGEVRRRAGRRDRHRADPGPQAAHPDPGRPARRRPVGPGGRAAGPALPAGDAAVPGGAHARRGGAAAQARHRRRPERRRGLLPRAGPRDVGRQGPRRAARPRGLRRQGVRAPRATPRSRSDCSATSTP